MNKNNNNNKNNNKNNIITKIIMNKNNNNNIDNKKNHKIIIMNNKKENLNDNNLVRSDFRVVLALLGHLPLLLHDPLQVFEEIPGRGHHTSGRIQFLHVRQHRMRWMRCVRRLFQRRFERIATRQSRRRWTVHQPFVECDASILFARTFT